MEVIVTYITDRGRTGFCTSTFDRTITAKELAEMMTDAIQTDDPSLKAHAIILTGVTVWKK